MADEPIVIRFLLALPTEDPAFVDIEFSDERQAKNAMTAVLRGQGKLVEIKNASSVPVLIRSDQVAAAFPAEFDNLDASDEEDEDEADDESADEADDESADEADDE